jgi:DNA-binding MarR family transcriptional regulator
MNELALENQLCFPLYATSKEIIKHYKELLDPLNLTYTQYLVMLVLWEKGTLNVKELGDALCLDSGTLTPVLKKLEQKEYLTRTRSLEDERSLNVSLTDKGEQLHVSASDIPCQIKEFLPLSDDELLDLHRLTTKMLHHFQVNPN